MSEPQVLFTPWRPWAQRGTPRIEPACGGVYLVAYCREGAPAAIPTLDTLPEEVIYIGEAKNLNKRPLTGTHQRFQTRYPQLFGPNKDSLFVTFARLYETGCADYDLKRVFSSYIEAMLVWRYTDRYQHPPAMHFKQKAEPPAFLDRVLRRLKK